MLFIVQARFEVDWSRPEWIEDELVRSGARDARILPDDAVAVTVTARSRDEADGMVRDLLARLGASGVEIAGGPGLPFAR